MNPARAERRAKALGLALVGSMFVVALGVHSWPRRAPLLSAAIPVRVAALAQPPAGILPVAIDHRIDPSPRISLAAQYTAEAVEPPALVTNPILLDTVPFATRAQLPDVEGQPVTAALEPDDEAPWDSMAHAGVALGRAFRRAGVKTAAAFGRVF